MKNIITTGQKNTLHKINKSITPSDPQVQSFYHHNAFDPHKFQSLTSFSFFQDQTPPNPPYRSTKLAPVKWQ